MAETGITLQKIVDQLFAGVAGHIMLLLALGTVGHCTIMPASRVDCPGLRPREAWRAEAAGTDRLMKQSMLAMRNDQGETFLALRELRFEAAFPHLRGDCFQRRLRSPG